MPSPIVRRALARARSFAPPAGALAPGAQATPGAARVPPNIAGVVRDSAGAPLPNVQVVLAELNHGQSTDAQGRFVFRSIPAPGTYHLDARLIGYAPQHVSVVVSAGGDPEPVTITLVPT